MQRQTPLDTSLTGWVAGGARGCVRKADDKPLMQELEVNFSKGEWRDQVEHPQNYGFTSVVREATYEDDKQVKECSEHFTQFMTANRAFPVTSILDDRRYRLRNQEEGEVTIYDDQQQSIKIKRKEIQTRSQKRITLRLIKDEDQHKDDAERDQQEHKDKPLSSMMFDKDTIEIIRTKDDGQLAAKKDEEDKKGTMLSRMFLTKGDDEGKDKVIIETPGVHLTFDEKAKTYVIATDTVSITVDETNKKIVLKTQQTGVTLHDQSGKVIIGDGVQGYQAARIGSLTSKGDVIVGRVATKVLVL